MLQPASQMFRMILGAPIAVVVAVACLLTIGPVPDREDNKGSANKGADNTVVVRAKAGRMRRVRK